MVCPICDSRHAAASESDYKNHAVDVQIKFLSDIPEVCSSPKCNLAANDATLDHESLRMACV